MMKIVNLLNLASHLAHVFRLKQRLIQQIRLERRRLIGHWRKFALY